MLFENLNIFWIGGVNKNVWFFLLELKNSCQHCHSTKQLRNHDLFSSSMYLKSFNSFSYISNVDIIIYQTFQQGKIEIHHAYITHARFVVTLNNLNMFNFIELGLNKIRLNSLDHVHKHAHHMTSLFIIFLFIGFRFLCSAKVMSVKWVYLSICMIMLVKH